MFKHDVVQCSFLYGVAERLMISKLDIERQKLIIQSSHKEAENWLNDFYQEALELLIQLFKFPSITPSRAELELIIKKSNINPTPYGIACAAYYRAIICAERQRIRAN